MSLDAVLSRIRPATSLRRKLLWAFAVMTLVPLLAANFIILRSTERAVAHAVFARNQGFAESLAGSLNREFNSIKRALQVAAENEAIRSMDRDRQVPVLRDIVANHPDLLIALVADADGNLVARSDGEVAPISYSDRNYFKEAKVRGEMVISEPIISKTTGKLGIACAVPIMGEDGALLGMVTGTIGLENATAHINQATVGKTGYAYVVGKDGRVLMHPDAEEMKRGADISSLEPVRLAMQGSDGSMEYPVNGVPYIVGYSHLPATGWGLIVQQPRDEVMADVTRDRWANWLGGLLSLVGALWVVRWLVGRIFSPIGDLIEGVRKVSEGDLHARVPVETRDEIGMLAATFNTMTDKLGQSVENLRENEEKFLKAFQKNPAGMVLTRMEDGLVLEVNRMFEKIFNSTSDEVVGKTSTELGFWKSKEDRAEFRQRLLAEGTVEDMEARFARRGGENFSALISGGVIRLKGVPSVISHITDISERKQAEERVVLLNSELEERVRQRTNELVLVQGELQAKADMLSRQQAELRQANQALEERTRALEASQADIQAKNGELELVNRYKSEFLTNMSHELRTPLNAMLLLSHLLSENKKGNLDAKQVEFAQTIHRSGSDLLVLINDILDLSKIESGKMQFHCDEVHLGDLVLVMQRVFGAEAEAKKLVFEVRAHPSAPVMLRSDSQRLQQILRNLLNNAIKFTEHGSITLTVRVPEAGEAPGMAVAVSVEDTGIGISPEQSALVFQMFKQVDGACNRRYGGVGMGLSISQGLVRCMGGEIRLESSLGKGSTFTVFLPEDIRFVPSFIEMGASQPEEMPPAPHPEPHAQEAKQDEEDQFAGRKILLVDDDARNIFSMTSVLEELGVTVIPAMDGREALDKMEETPDLAMVLMDIMMPVMDGYEAICAIRCQERFKTIPIVALTAKAMPGDSDRCLQAGASDYLCKPIDVDRFVVLLKKWLNPVS